MIWLLVGAGGALGSVARYGLNRLIQQQSPAATFPLGIFLANVLGSAVIGVLAVACWAMVAERRARAIISRPKRRTLVTGGGQSRCRSPRI